jgi:MOSC domain-containing protein YiiM
MPDELSAPPAARLVSVQVGPVAPLGSGSVLSGFVKRPVDGPVWVGPLGLAGDQQADRSVHGGPEKAVYAYPQGHYAHWRAEFPDHAALWVPGGVGENLTVAGQEENDVYLGDVFRLGSVLLLQVTQPRQPCFKFGLRFGDPRLPRAMVQTGRSGWYLRVLAPGQIAAGEAFTLLERPNPRWPVARLNRLIVARSAPAADWRELAELPGLAAGWQGTARGVCEGREHRFCCSPELR